MRREKLAFAASAVYVWTAMLAFGGIAVETIIIYPNVFYDVPRSLDQAVEFFAVTGPADFVRPMGAAILVVGAATLALVWPDRAARFWIGLSLLSLFLGGFLFSMIYFWPRNEIMFTEGLAVHSIEFLRQTAFEFETAHWLRLALSGVTATLALVGFLRTHRRRVLAAVREA